MDKGLQTTVSRCLGAALVVAGCKGASPRQMPGPASDARGAQGVSLVDAGSEHLPAYLHNLADISVIADPGKRQVIISAPPGSVTSQTVDAVVTVWEIGADVTAAKYKVDGNRILLPAKLRAETRRTPDGAFNVEISDGGHGAVLISTEADPAAGVVILRQGAPGISAGIKNPFDDAPLKPLGYTDFTDGNTSAQGTGKPVDTAVVSSGGWDG